MYRSVCVKVGELEGLNEQLDKSLPTPVARISTRVAHVRNRIRHLESLYPEVAGNLQMDVSSLSSRLTAVEQVLQPASECIHETAFLSDGQLPKGNAEEGREQQVPVDIRGSSRNTVSREAGLQPSEHGGSSHFPVGRSVVAPFYSGIFSKLPHPVEGLLKKLPRVNGVEVEPLLGFFGRSNSHSRSVNVN
jgi:hypothetical protein